MKEAFAAGPCARTSLVLALLWLGGCAWKQHDLPRYKTIDAGQIRLADDIRLARDGWPWWNARSRTRRR
jgi:hypothetical protein